MFRVLENMVHHGHENEERILAVMRFKAHAIMFAEWAGENCCETSTIFLQEAIGLLEQIERDNMPAENRRWKTIRIYQPLKLREPFK